MVCIPPLVRICNADVCILVKDEDDLGVSSGKTFTKFWYVSKSEKGKIIISVPDRLTYPYSKKSLQNQLPG